MNGFLGSYLKKFENFLPYETRVKNAIIQVFQELFSITLERNQISLSGKQVFIQGSSALKSEISLKQFKILMKLKEVAPGLNIERVL